MVFAGYKYPNVQPCALLLVLEQHCVLTGIRLSRLRKCEAGGRAMSEFGVCFESGLVCMKTVEVEGTTKN